MFTHMFGFNQLMFRCMNSKKIFRYFSVDTTNYGILNYCTCSYLRGISSYCVNKFEFGER